MRNKIGISILLGLFYWILIYAAMKLFVLVNIEYSDYVGKFFYYIIPLLLGALLIIIRERRYVGIVYSSMIIIVRYILTLIELAISLPAGRNPIEETFWLFNMLGKYSMLIAMLGGLLAVFINKRRIKIVNPVRS